MPLPLSAKSVKSVVKLFGYFPYASLQLILSLILSPNPRTWQIKLKQASPRRRAAPGPNCLRKKPVANSATVCHSYFVNWRNIDMREFMAITKALSDPGRVRILLALRRGELCVCQITELFGLAPSTMSKHLSVLHQGGLIASRKAERWVYYRLPDETAPGVVKIR